MPLRNAALGSAAGAVAGCAIALATLPPAITELASPEATKPVAAAPATYGAHFGFDSISLEPI